jgi:hypothetical protein
LYVAKLINITKHLLSSSFKWKDAGGDLNGFPESKGSDQEPRLLFPFLIPQYKIHPNCHPAHYSDCIVIIHGAKVVVHKVACRIRRIRATLTDFRDNHIIAIKHIFIDLISPHTAYVILPSTMSLSTVNVKSKSDLSIRFNKSI